MARMEVHREHPLETPYGTLFARPEGRDRILVTSGDWEQHTSTMMTWGRERSIEVAGHRYEVQLCFQRHSDGRFRVGEEGAQHHRTPHGDLWINERPRLGGMPVLWRVPARRQRRAEPVIVAAAEQALNDWALENGQVLDDAEAARVSIEQERERRGLERRLGELDEERDRVKAALSAFEEHEEPAAGAHEPRREPTPLRRPSSIAERESGPSLD